MGDEHEDRYDLSAPLPVQEKRIQFSVKKSASTHSLLSARQLISDCEKGQANPNFKVCRLFETLLCLKAIAFY